MTAFAAMVNLVSGSVLLGLAWRSNDHTTRRAWQWSIWMLGCAAFAIGAALLRETLIAA